MAYIPGQYSKTVAIDQHKKEMLKKQDEKNNARNEREYASKLHMAGRTAYFKEYFENIKLEDQELPKIGPFEKITETYSFKEGYKKGAFLVEIGAIPEEYQQEQKPKHK